MWCARREHHLWAGADEILVVDANVTAAFAVGGPTPTVVISRGLLAADLPPDEVRAVLEHERSHLRHHHLTWKTRRIGGSWRVPLLLAPCRRIAFLLERWADEDAARVVGNRSVVASAIARVPLAVPGERRGVSGFGASSTIRRVRALLEPPPPDIPTLAIAIASSSVRRRRLGPPTPPRRSTHLIARRSPPQAASSTAWR